MTEIKIKGYVELGMKTVTCDWLQRGNGCGNEKKSELDFYKSLSTDLSLSFVQICQKIKGRDNLGNPIFLHTRTELNG